MLIAILLLVAVSCQWERADAIIRQVNANVSSTWRAAHNRFSSWTLEELQLLVPCAHSRPSGETDINIVRHRRQIFDGGLPDNFNSSSKWPDCPTIVHIRNQGQCGSCWAFAGSEVLSDHFCIEKKKNVLLSPQDLVSCDRSDEGCGGGIPSHEWNWMMNQGIVSDSCLPYVSGTGNVPPCPKECDGKPMEYQRYRAFEAHLVTQGSMQPVFDIQVEIYRNGPVEATFLVYQDFMNYHSGVYQHTTGGLLGGHAVKIVGWGVTAEGTKYWKINNSWGADWGMDGVFWILRGSDECEIEKDVWTGYAGQGPF